MVPPALGDNLDNIKTEPKMAGSDPTLNTLIEFNVPLATDPLYCPKLMCTVYDSIAMGLAQPIIGTFTIEVGKLIHELIAERERETEDIEDVIKALKKYVMGDQIAASMKTMLKTKMEEEAAKTEAELIK